MNAKYFTYIHAMDAVLRLREGAWTIVGVLTGKAPVRAEPFEAVELVLGELWPDAAAG